MVYKPKKRYQWNEDYKLSIDPNIVGGVLEQIEKKDGNVTASSFLEMSRPENSPTHSIFEWDDTAAAEHWRLHQSRTTIGALRIVYEEGEKKIPVRAFIKTNEHERTTYENVQDALSDDNKKAIILNRLRAEVDSLVIRNQHIIELADILEEAAAKIRTKK